MAGGYDISVSCLCSMCVRAVYSILSLFYSLFLSMSVSPRLEFCTEYFESEILTCLAICPIDKEVLHCNCASQFPIWKHTYTPPHSLSTTSVCHRIWNELAQYGGVCVSNDVTLLTLLLSTDVTALWCLIAL